MFTTHHMRKGIALIVFSLVFVPAVFVQAQSINFSVSFPAVSDDFTRDVPKHTQYISVKGFAGSTEYGMRVVDADSGAVISSGATVPKGTRLKLEFLPETMSYFTTGSSYDSPYAKWVTGTPPVQCLSENRVFHYNKTYKGRPGILSIFAPVFAKRPAHSITNVAALGACTGPEDARICTAENIGTHTMTFTWAPSTASMYLRVYNKDDTKHAQPHSRWPRYDTCEPFGPLSSRNDFAGGAKNVPQSTVTLPQKTKPFTVIVEEGPEVPSEPPQQPNLAAAGGACVVGQAYSITMTANDPEGDKVRYLVDWNSDGVVDQFAPASGYVNSGTAQAASKTFATPGSKTVRVRAQDDKGKFSGWASFSFTCTGEPDPTVVELDGEENPELGEDPGVFPSINDLSLRALPSLVRLGATTKVHWSSQNMTSCTVTGSNGDSWTGLTSPVSGEVSGAINSLVTYTLTCRAGASTFTKTATVNVLPSWVEK
jgi:hypothetical protein